MVGRNRRQVQEEDWVAKVAWRVVGAIESPLVYPRLTHLIRDVVSKYVPDSQQKRTIETIYGWYETRDGLPALADHTKDAVDELVLIGAAQQLLEARPDPRSDTLLWALGAVDPEKAAETIQGSWCPKQIDALLEYVTDALQVLCENHNVIDPSGTLGFKVEKGKAYVNPEYKQERIKTLHITDRYPLDLYHAVAKVVQLTMTVMPDQFPQVGRKGGPPYSTEMGPVHRISTFRD